MDIAVVGMSCIFPGAPDLDTYWNNIINKVSAIKVAPEHRISNAFFDPSSSDIDRLYCNRGGFIDEFADFNPVQFGFVPNAVNSTEPEQLLCLKVAHAALEDADVFSKRISLQNAGVVIGKGGYGGTELNKLAECIIGGELLVDNLRYAYPRLNDEQLLKAKKIYQAKRGNFGPQNVMGTVPNISASIIANRFDFAGPAYVVDAACASSLIAVDHAVKELKVGSCDLMLVGAVHVGQNPVLWSVFSMMGAFSKNQIVRPFDKKADGVLAGEGCGFVVLRRLADAIKDDQRIYAIIKGVGVSSDGANASLMSPSTKGQLRAIRNAWSGGNLSMDDIGYIEAHGTGTVLGDAVELETLRQFFGHNSKLPMAGLGAVKSMIGHAMPAAGMAGFIKTTLALFHNKIPPTLNCDDPLDEMKSTRFKPIPDVIDWSQTGLPDVAGVNAFGFGGANAHVVLKGFNTEKKSASGFVGRIPNPEDEVVLMARDSKERLISDLEKGDYSAGKGSHRLALFNPTPARVHKAINIIRKGLPWRNRLDISYTSSPLFFDTKNKLAFIFPGFDGLALTSVEVGDFEALANRFNLPKPIYNKFKTGIQVNLSVDESCRLLDNALKKLNIIPDVIAGHSMGEWTGCYAAGLVDDESIMKIEEQSIRAKHEAIDRQLLMVAASKERVEPFLKQYNNLHLALDNCPQQIVICGSVEDVKKFQKILSAENITSFILPFTSLFHTPFAETYVNQVRHNLDHIVKFSSLQKIPIWSGITASPYPESIAEIKQLHIDFMIKPVRFRELIVKLYHSGIRYFIQIGAGATIGFIDDTLKDLDFASIASGSTKRTSLSQMMRVVASLYVEGREVELSLLRLKKTNLGMAKGFNMKLDLGYKALSLESVLTASDIPLSKPIDNVLASGISHSIIESFNENLDRINKTQSQLLQYLSGNNVHQASHMLPPVKIQRGTANKRTDFRKTINLSLDAYPELKDHCPFRKRTTTDDFSNENEPVVPLTMFIELFIETLQEFNPWAKVFKVINVKVYQFLWVLKIKDIDIVGKWLNDDIVQIEVAGYVKLSCMINGKNETGNMLPLVIANSVEAPIKATDIYDKFYMFHGLRYQGIREILAYSDNGMEVVISGAYGKGAMLDNIGQTIGVYYHLSGRSIYAFPVGLQEIVYSGDPLDTNGVFTCTCLLQKQDDEFLYADIELKRQGKRWAYIKGWQNRKTEIDEALFQTRSITEGNFLSKKIGDGISLMPRIYKRMNTWFIASTIYCNSAETKIYDTLSPAKQKTWLLGRIAVKDAIRHVIERKTKMALHPASFSIYNEASGKPFSESKFADKIHISIAHKDDCAVAYASLDRPVGIDIETIIENPESLWNAVLNDSEKEMIMLKGNKNEWLTRCWVAKEAYGKMIGEGLKGNPKRFRISEINGDFFTVENAIIKTVLLEKYVLGYTI